MTSTYLDAGKGPQGTLRFAVSLEISDQGRGEGFGS